MASQEEIKAYQLGYNDGFKDGRDYSLIPIDMVVLKKPLIRTGDSIATPPDAPPGFKGW